MLYFWLLAGSVLTLNATAVAKSMTAGHHRECPGLDGQNVFILNLDRRKDRLDDFQEMMGSSVPWMCAQTCRVSAPDASSWGKQLAESIIPASTTASESLPGFTPGGASWKEVSSLGPRHISSDGWKLTKGGVGSLVGHALVWEHVLQNNIPWAVVFEDDVGHINPEARNIMCDIGELSLQQDWQFLLLNSFNSSKTKPGKLHVEANNDNVHTHRYGLQAYAISQKGASSLLQNLFPMSDDRVIDGPGGVLWSDPKSYVAFPGMAGGRSASGAVSDRSESLTQRSEKDKCKIVNCPALDKAKMVVPALANPTQVTRSLLIQPDGAALANPSHESLLPLPMRTMMRSARPSS